MSETAKENAPVVTYMQISTGIRPWQTIFNDIVSSNLVPDTRVVRDVYDKLNYTLGKRLGVENICTTATNYRLMIDM